MMLRIIAMVVALLAASAIVYAVPPPPKGTAPTEEPDTPSQQDPDEDRPRVPPKGPKKEMIYHHIDGSFRLIPGGPGEAVYEWDSDTYVDELNYTDDVKALDRNGKSVDCWLYRATDDAGDHWWLAFSKNSLTVVDSRPAFGIWYSHQSKRPKTADLTRWVTPSWTRRLILP